MSNQPDFYKSLLDNLSDGVYFVNRERRITYWNRGAERITGYAGGQVVGCRCSDGLLMHVDDVGTQLCQAACPLVYTMNDGRPREAQVYLKHAEGHRVPVLIRVAPIRSASGEVIGAVETFSDNSSLIDAQRRADDLSRVAFMDELTGVGNRRFIESRLPTVLAEALQGGAAAVLFIDIDRFKPINDDFGHAAGDEVLRLVAKTLRANVRGTDLIGRWGGDEFFVSLSPLPAERVGDMAHRLRALVEQSRVTVGPVDLRVTVSIGATVAREGDTPETLVQRVDRLLYQSKAHGRNSVTLDI